MKKLVILDRTGDTVLEFAEADIEAQEKAKKVFDEWMAKNRPAFNTKRPSGQPDEKIHMFEQIEDGAETVLVPPIVAG